MAVWNIDTAGAASTLKAAASHVEASQPSLEGMGKALEQAAASIPGDAAVVLNALNDVVVLGLTPSAGEVAGRSETILTSTAKALAFYQQGDLAMATAAQRNAALAETTAPAPVHGGPAQALKE